MTTSTSTATTETAPTGSVLHRTAVDEHRLRLCVVRHVGRGAQAVPAIQREAVSTFAPSNRSAAERMQEQETDEDSGASGHGNPKRAKA